MRVFLTGANGWVGSAVARDLLDAGHSVVGLVRSKEKGEAFVAAGGTPLVGSLTDLDVLRQGASAAGGSMPTVLATIPGSVISVSIDPSKGRARFKKARARYFDRDSATFITKDVEIEAGDDDSLEVVDEIRGLAADEEQAESFANAHKSDAEREGGDGSIEMDLAVEAQAEGTLILSGARPGIDGTYRIVGVTHRATRSGGATTSLEIKQPQGEAGRDSRVPIPTPRPI